MITIEKKEMKKSAVYICGDFFADSPFAEMTCLDNNGDKISVIIPYLDKTSAVLVKKNEQIIFSFDNHKDFKIFLNENIQREELQEIFFLWIFWFIYNDKKYKELSEIEHKIQALDETRNKTEERFKITFNDNIKNINILSRTVRDEFVGHFYLSEI